MAADDAGRLKCRLRLEATWTDDGSLEGTIEQKYWAVRAFGAFAETDCIELKALDRARIQTIYVPASRDARRRYGGSAWVGRSSRDDTVDITVSNALRKLPGCRR